MRATQAPEQWQLLLTALKHDDVDEAHRICIKYQFNKCEEPPIPIPVKKKPYRLYKYHYITPCGTRGTEPSTPEMAKRMGIKPGTVSMQFKNKDTAVWTKGPRKGWELRREPR